MPPKATPEKIESLKRQITQIADEIAYTLGKRGELLRLARALDERDIRGSSGGLWANERTKSPTVLTDFLKRYLPAMVSAPVSPGVTQATPARTGDQTTEELPADIKQHRAPLTSHTEDTGPQAIDATPESSDVLPATDAQEDVEATPEEHPVLPEEPDALLEAETGEVLQRALQVLPPVISKEHDLLQDPPITPEKAARLIEMLKWWEENQGERHGQGVPLFRALTKDETTTRSIRIDTELLEEAEKAARAQRSKTGGTLNSLIKILLWRFLGEDPKYLAADEDDQS